ncbi:hypothetical protein QVD17_37763 [Tagetes erecta]|uniref:Wall-associated receptor kinase domain-containing protein n=1 Tax=Tagetes erecta TaxID=13708 RepID=A0AAD8JV92_TARER|nr:hypothetical protein QVD17_37763 [Tagetes erecta]
MDNGSVVTSCISTACIDFTHSGRNNCFGIGCCQTTIPHYLKSYSINVTRLEEGDEGCGSAFLVDEASYDEGRFNVRNTSFIPVSLRWTLTDSDQITCCSETRRLALGMFNGTSVYTWDCYFPQDFTGNPYLKDGCVYISDDTGCGKCNSYCRSEDIFDVDGLFISRNFTCYQDVARKTISVGVVIVKALYVDDTYTDNVWTYKDKALVKPTSQQFSLCLE